MSKTVTEIPYTEMVERVVSLGRVNPNAIEKVRGIIQDIYTRDIPTKYDWTFLHATSAITSVEEYITGTVSVNTNSRIASFSSDATMVAEMSGRRIKFSGNSVVYDVSSFITTRSLQLVTPFQGPANITDGSYTIFQPIYALAPDFDRFPKDGGVFRWSGGNKERLPEEPFQEYADNFSGGPSIPEKVRLVGIDTAGNQLIEFRPAPNKARVYSYEYLKRLSPMQETTASLIRAVSSGGTAVMLIGTNQFAEVSTAGRINYFRVNLFGKGQDSEWFPVLAYTGNSSFTLRTAFGNSAVTSSAGYTLSEAPQIPTMLHPAIMYGTLAHIMADQGDDNAELYLQRASQIIQEAKRLYASRTYSQDIHGIQEDWDYRR